MNLNPFTAIKFKKPETPMDDRTHAQHHYSLGGQNAAAASGVQIVAHQTAIGVATAGMPKQVWLWNGHSYDTEAEATAAADAALDGAAAGADTEIRRIPTFPTQPSTQPSTQAASAKAEAAPPPSGDALEASPAVSTAQSPVEAPAAPPAPVSVAARPVQEAAPAPETTTAPAQPAQQETSMTTAATTATAVTKESVGQEIGNFFKRLASTAAKDFSWVAGEIAKAQPIVSAVEGATALIPGGAPVSAAVALGDGIVSNGAQVIANALNTLAAAGVSGTTVTPAVVSSLAAQIEQKLQSDPTIATLIEAAGGTPANEAAFNGSLGALSAALTNLLLAI